VSEFREMPADVEAVVFDVDGVLTDGCLHYTAEGETQKVFHARDGMGMAMLRDSGVRMALISGRHSPVIETRVRELGVTWVKFGRMDKARALQELADEWEIPLARIAAIGDDLVDLPMLRRAGFSAAPSDADPRVRAVVDRVMTLPGGRGAVRELAELVLRARGDFARFAARFELEEGE
jgi:3-deoxy-D-manno-octulosonate 8-phosphate phosphatase (KDO 8-P phosphatase)